MAAVLGMAIVAAAALALYASSPLQQLTALALPRTALRCGGWAGLVAGLVLLLQWAGPATAVFIALTLATLVWTIIPPVAAWWRRPKGQAR